MGGLLGCTLDPKPYTLTPELGRGALKPLNSNTAAHLNLKT
jgi:hypothetical protein